MRQYQNLNIPLMDFPIEITHSSIGHVYTHFDWTFYDLETLPNVT